ncbi:MAG: DUF362 domain-containing protein [Phycisphaerae bacterium]
MLNRRDFLKSAAGAAALGGVAGCRPGGGASPAQTPGRVFIGSAASYDADLSAIISAGLQAFPDFDVQGKTVLLKPNLVETTTSDRPINTHPAVIVAAAESLRRAGARAVIVGDGPGHRRDAELVLAQSGLGRALHEARLPFVDLNHDEVVPVANLGSQTRLKTLYFPRTVLAADVVVSLAKLKTHHWAGVTLSLKNCFGLMPGLVYGWPKNILHWEGIEHSIVDIVSTIKPQFGIVDGVIGMEGDGPLMGSAKPVGVIALGDRLASLDATCAALMGLRPERIGYIQWLAERGFGAGVASAIEQRGERLARFRTPFAVLPQFASLCDAAQPALGNTSD